MNKIVFIYIGLAITTLFGCDSRKMTSHLEAISKIAEDNPDSALVLLDKYEPEKINWSKGDRMYYELVKLKVQNKLDVVFTTDTIINNIVDYFNSHGTDNERMLAYYLQGRVFADMGEAPQALQAYYDAIGCADTTSSDCDYDVLIPIYGQMSRIFHQQNLPNDEIWALKHYVEYIRIHDCYKEYIIAKGQMIRPYYLLNEKDSMLSIINETCSALKQLGEYKEAADALVVSISIYLERNDLVKAKHAMSIFENESGLFDKNGDIAKGRESYYITKGCYYLAINNADSAEIYFRKALNYGYTSDAYKGLLTVYHQRMNVDSIMHYSVLKEKSLDSLHNKMQTYAIHQMSKLYNYSRIQKEAEQEREKAQDRLFLLVLISFMSIFLLIVIVFVVWLYRVNQKEKKNKIAELEETLNISKSQRNTIQEELKILKEKNYESIIALKEKQEIELTKQIQSLQAESVNKRNAIDSKHTDNPEAFLKSSIAQQFVRKATGKSNGFNPTESEWNLLVSQFSKDLSVTYKSFGRGKSLSQLEQRVCILLILNISEKIIALMLETHATTISNAKSRANEKLFGEKNAHLLKNNLINGFNALDEF
ncbi:hypothetical protein L6475_01105 [Prevotella sp. E9-3]|uniref:hypothetical protein n=1 Tax=Prevotella sp. E9-3 TaxID=2913621 RepID=UPI001EDC441F|nr:hypothetical protein [Prevotella sp. E9-3]UKK48591.1 hypothetical protein L6475_01105 [Prevotella sp. E9-3]